MEIGGKTFAEGYIDYAKKQTWLSKKSVSKRVKSRCTCPGPCGEAEHVESWIEDTMWACRSIIEDYNGMGEYGENRQKLLDCLEKLRKLPILFCAISATGIDEAVSSLVMRTSVTKEAVMLLDDWWAAYDDRNVDRLDLEDPGYESDDEFVLEPPKVPSFMWIHPFRRWLMEEYPSNDDFGHGDNYERVSAPLRQLPIGVRNRDDDAAFLSDEYHEESDNDDEPRVPLVRRRRVSEHSVDVEAPEGDDDSEQGSLERPDNPNAEMLERPRGPEVNVLEPQPSPALETIKDECACPPEYCRFCR